MSSPDANPSASALPSHAKILAAVAFDVTGEQALLQALSLVAENPSTELHVVHVVTSELSGIAAMRDTDSQLEQAPAVLRERIEQAWQKRPAAKVIAHIRPGPAVETILQVAVDIEADLLIVGSHRLRGIPKLVLGSVAERVLREAHCPVLVAVPKDYSGQAHSPGVEPPCADCVRTRHETANARFWCERHSKPYLQPHLYVPRTEERASVLVTH
jgi:nucleotide-binding universal stress UspA family protein